jgi:hypothetical protein
VGVCCAQWLPEILYFLPGAPIALVEAGIGREEDWVISSKEGSQVAECLGACFVRSWRNRPKSALIDLANIALQGQKRYIRR